MLVTYHNTPSRYSLSSLLVLWKNRRIISERSILYLCRYRWFSRISNRQLLRYICDLFFVRFHQYPRTLHQIGRPNLGPHGRDMQQLAICVYPESSTSRIFVSFSSSEQRRLWDLPWGEWIHFALSPKGRLPGESRNRDKRHAEPDNEDTSDIQKSLLCRNALLTKKNRVKNDRKI